MKPDRVSGSLGRCCTPYGRPAGLRLLLCTMVLGTLLASSAFPQILEGTILLPDSLGPLTGATHVALDENPTHPRMFIGGEGGGVLVVDAITCQRIARIPTGPVASAAITPRAGKAASANRNTTQ